MKEIGALAPSVLPAGVTSRFVDGVNGLRVHLLEAGVPTGPTLLLLHGFPELAYSWRHLMPRLVEAGYRVIAPDLRGYGRTSPWPSPYDDDLAPFRLFNMVRDAIGLLDALDIRDVGLAGHDYGAVVAAWCALLRPDIFRAVALMSAPFAGPPGLRTRAEPDIHAALAALPRPRKHYQWYYSTPPANEEMWHAPEGIGAFLRAYFHMKSADWPDNRPHRLSGWTAEGLAVLPTYYIMDRDQGMAATVAPHRPSGESQWLADTELAVYAEEYGRTGFQGGLNSYRCRTTGAFRAEEQLMAGRRIEQPSLFIAGQCDWGTYQTPGALERMQETVCADMRGAHLVEGAGHWVQQEQPAATARLLEKFFHRTLRGAEG